MKHDVTLFAIATLLPVPLLVLGAVAGGWWLWAALVYLTLFALMLDELVAFVASPARPETEFPAADWLSGTLAVAHFLLLGLAVWALSCGSGLGAGDKVTAFLAKHKAKPLDATDVLSTAQGKAFKHDRKLLIHLSAPS